MLTVHCLEIVTEAATPLAFDTYCGSALRGAFFRALWGRFCTNREAPVCSLCPLVTACPVADLVAPLRDEATHGQDIPRPYVISVPYQEKNRYEQGESFTFGFTLIGTSTKLFPYVIRSFQEMEKSSLGRPLPELQGRRGQIKIREIRAYHPFTGEQKVLWEKESNCPIKPQLYVTSDDIIEHAEDLPRDHITIHFLTPTRLIFDDRLVKHPSLRVLTLRLAQRFTLLQDEYSNGGRELEEEGPRSTSSSREFYQQIEKQTHDIRMINDETHWVDILSYSARQRKTTPIGGFIGRASYEGDITHLRELLVWGEVLHVGKNIVKGNGMYRIEA